MMGISVVSRTIRAFTKMGGKTNALMIIGLNKYWSSKEQTIMVCFDLLIEWNVQSMVAYLSRVYILI